MRWLVCLSVCLSLSLLACADEAVKGTEAADNCADVTCPVGTSPILQSEAESACGGSVSGERGLTDLGVSGSAQCFGSGSCSLICAPPEPCCGGEKWTSDSYECDKPCAAACSCDGKCGTVTGPDCEAECEPCGNGQVCSNNTCVDDCPEGGELCGDACFFVADGEACYLEAICNPSDFCVDRECNDESWDGKNPCEDCEALGAPGCAPDEVCGGGVCVADDDCQDDLPVCGVGVEANVVKACKPKVGGTWGWADAENCSESDEYCDNGPTGASCVACIEDAHCDEGAPGETLACQGGECVVLCTPDCEGKACGDDGCQGNCGLADTTNGCGEDAPYCQGVACQTMAQACAVPGGELVNACNASADEGGTLYHEDLSPQAIVECKNSGADSISIGLVLDCALNIETPWCDDAACVACYEHLHCSADGTIVCIDNACVPAVACPAAESFCNTQVIDGEAGVYTNAYPGSTVLTCTVDVDANVLLFGPPEGGECADDEVCVDKDADGVKSAACETTVEPCPGEFLCNELPDGSAYVGLANHSEIVSCEIDDVANVQVFVAQKECAAEMTCLDGACVAKKGCPVDEDAVVCNAWAAENGLEAEALVTCAVDKWTHNPQWALAETCDGQICFEGACADEAACAAEAMCNTIPDSQANAQHVPESPPHSIITCAVVDNALVFDFDAVNGVNCASNGAGQVCVQDGLDSAPVCEDPLECPADQCSDEGEAFETCEVNAYNELVWTPTACEAGEICVPKSASCAVPMACSVPAGVAVCNEGTPYGGADVNDVVICTVDEENNLLDWDMVDCGQLLCHDGLCDTFAPEFASFTVNGQTDALPEFDEAAWLTLAATFAGADTASVTFYDGQQELVVDQAPPFEHKVLLANADNGQHDYWARAVDTSQNMTDSDTVQVSVFLPPAAIMVWSVEPVEQGAALGGTANANAKSMALDPNGDLRVAATANVLLDEAQCSALGGASLGACLAGLDNDDRGVLMGWSLSEAGVAGVPAYAGRLIVDGLYPVESVAFPGDTIALTGTDTSGSKSFAWSLLNASGDTIAADILGEPEPGGLAGTGDYSSVAVATVDDELVIIGGRQDAQGSPIIVAKGIVPSGPQAGAVPFTAEDDGNFLYSYVPYAADVAPNGDIIIVGARLTTGCPQGACDPCENQNDCEPGHVCTPQKLCKSNYLSEFVRRMTPEGGALWTRPSLNVEGEPFTLKDVAVDAQGDVIVAAQYYDGGNDLPVLRKYAGEDGELMWEHFIFPLEDNVGPTLGLYPVISSIALKPDGKIVFTGAMLDFPICENGVCEEGETGASCPVDCAYDPLCGDNTCNGDETTDSCPEDCKDGGAVCGDGLCSLQEYAQNCPHDCDSPHWFDAFGTWVGVLEDKGSTAEVVWHATPIDDELFGADIVSDDLGYLYVLTRDSAWFKVTKYTP